MEFMVAWYPLVRFIVLMLVLLSVVWVGYKKWYKTAAMLFAVMLLVWWFAPVKIDGTNSMSHHKSQVTYQTQKYKHVEADLPTVVEVKKSFEERMADESRRSKLANEEVTHEITKQ